MFACSLHSFDVLSSIRTGSNSGCGAPSCSTSHPSDFSRLVLRYSAEHVSTFIILLQSFYDLDCALFGSGTLACHPHSFGFRFKNWYSLTDLSSFFNYSTRLPSFLIFSLGTLRCNLPAFLLVLLAAFWRLFSGSLASHSFCHIEFV